MKQRNLIGIVLAAAAWLSPALSHASPDFPGEIAYQLSMPCPPPCGEVWQSVQGGDELAGNFVLGVYPAGGLQPGNVASVRTALASINTSMRDSDMDGTSDVAELQAGRNPNLALTATENDLFACPPAYGCGARIAPQPPIDGSALASALVVAGLLGMRLRRRRA